MTHDERRKIVGLTEVRTAQRWAKNNLTEVLNNHHTVISPEARDCIRAAIAALSEAEEHL
jgi:hypothetical protein